MAFSHFTFADEQCADAKTKIDLLMKSYSEAAFKSKSESAERTYNNIQKYLLQNLTPDNPCFESAVEEYLTESFRIYDPTTREVEDIRTGALINAFDKPFLRDSPHYLNELFAAKTLVFLTDKRRSDLGGLWTEHDPLSGQYNMIGGYDCAETKIYLDATLRPYDLTMTAYHELDHLVRDKLQDKVPSIFLEEPSNPENKVNWNLYDLADEADAIATSIGVFTAARAQIYVKSNSSPFAHIKYHYRLSNDFTLFGNDGPVAQLRDLLRNDEHYAISDLLFNPDGFKWVGMDPVPSVENQTEALREKIFSVIWETYFPTDELPFGAADKLVQFFNSPEISTFKFPSFRRWEGGGLDYQQWAFLRPFKADTYSLGTLLKSGPSPVCKQYIDSLDLGSVSHYLGLKYSKTSTIRPCANFKNKL
jgi:hypothetical protein